MSVCVSAPEAINNEWRNIDHIATIKLLEYTNTK